MLVYPAAVGPAMARAAEAAGRVNIPVTGPDTPSPGEVDCRRCGACCAYSAEWPRFTLESDAALARIPDHLVDASGARMRCDGDRCAALAGTVGVATSCTVYDDRPEVCRACVPGDDACLIARARLIPPARGGAVPLP